MGRVRIYRFKIWDQQRGDYVESERLARLDVIEASQQLVLIREGALEVDETLLDGDGMTRRPTPEGDT